MEFEKKAFSGSKVKELILIGTGADLFQFQAGAFKESRVQSIVVKNMTFCQYRKLVRKIRKAGYSGKITNDSW